MSANHSKFIDHLKKSEDARWFIAWWLSQKGKTVYMPPSKIAPSHEQWKDYIDKGDVFCFSDKKKKWIRNEVKELKVNFTCVDDWPFGKDFIVCAKHSYDGAEEKPAYYFILSNDWKFVALVDTKHADRWTTKEKADSRYEGEEAKQTFYYSPIEDIKWISMEIGDQDAI